MLAVKLEGGAGRMHVAVRITFFNPRARSYLHPQIADSPPIPRALAPRVAESRVSTAWSTVVGRITGKP